VVQAHPEWFAGWTEADYAELYSHFGAGGALTEAGANSVVLAMNGKRDVHRKVALVLESGEAELLTQMVDVLYQRIVLTGPAS
jgi:hypothetical protein